MEGHAEFVPHGSFKQGGALTNHKAITKCLGLTWRNVLESDTCSKEKRTLNMFYQAAQECFMGEKAWGVLCDNTKIIFRQKPQQFLRNYLLNGNKD